MRSIIDDTTIYACDLLGQYTFGTVHSVYQKTINLQLGPHLLSIQSAGSPISPLSLITNLDPYTLERLTISRGETATINDSRLFLSGHEFSWKHARIYNTALTTTLSAAQSSMLCDAISIAISDTSDTGFQPLFAASTDITSSPILLTAKNRILACDNFFLSFSYNDAAKALLGLLGLGIGLTPSGDDFLCGVLASLQLQNVRNHPFSCSLRRQIACRLADTNDISGAFLQCALENQYGVALCGLSALPSSLTIRSTFAAIGHSSGIDTLCGVLYGLHLFA